MPGIGTIIPTFLVYALEKRLSKHPERFGQGAIEGVAGPEAANNAATGGALHSAPYLGVAPNVPMAVLLGAFLLHGVQPGPLMITERPEAVLGRGGRASMYVGNVLLLVLNLPLIGLWVQLLRVPYGILFPLILLFCVIGVWSEAGNVADLVVLLGFGLLGYLMKKLDFEPAPLVLAFVLGRMAEEALRQSLLLSRGSPGHLRYAPTRVGPLGSGGGGGRAPRPRAGHPTPPARAIGLGVWGTPNWPPFAPRSEYPGEVRGAVAMKTQPMSSRAQSSPSETARLSAKSSATLARAVTPWSSWRATP